VVLAAFGLVVGLLPGVPRLQLDPALILGFFVPALVFEGALNLDLAALRQVWRPVAMLATAGVVMSIGLVAALTHAVLGLDWPAALLLGAILSPTDPIAVVAVIRRSGAPPPLAALLEGESLFNDGTGVAAFTAILAATAAGQFSLPGAAFRFALVSVVGIAIGGAIGLAGAALVRRTTNTVLEVGLTLVVAYGSYALASIVASAGVMAVVAAGVAMARVGHWGHHTERSWARIVIVLSAVLFTVIGIGLPARAVFGSAAAVAFGFAILFATRLVPIHVLGFGIPHRWRQLLWWGGVRGALSIALALAASGQPGVNRSVPVLAYGIVAISLVLQGALVRPAVRLLRLQA
jgi:CPA1 family monovalent cation:H+ antiporter